MALGNGGNDRPGGAWSEGGADRVSRPTVYWAEHALCIALALATGLAFGAIYSELLLDTGLPFVAVKQVRALDGDTVEATFVLHVEGYDAPELDSQRCDTERRRAELSRDRANELLSHPPVRIKLVGENENGKFAARIVAGDRPLGLMLESEGHLKRSDGGPLNWCSGEATDAPDPVQQLMAILGLD